jgi:hypothetical protein
MAGTFAIGICGRCVMNRILLAAALIVALSISARADEPPSPQAIFAEALDTAASIADADDRANALLSIAAAQGVAGAWPAARSTLRDAFAAATVESQPRDDDTLRKIAALQCGSWIAAGDETLGGARWFMEQYASFGGLTATDRIGGGPVDVDAALATIGRIRGPEQQFWALWSLARLLIEAERSADLRRPIRELLASADRLDAETWRAEVLALIAWLQTVALDSPGADATFAQADTIARARRSNAERGWGLRYLAAARHAGGDRAKAADTLTEALAAARATADAAERADLLLALGRGQSVVGDQAGVRTTVDEAMSAVAAIADMDMRAWRLFSIAALQASVDDVGVDDTLRRGIAAAASTRDERLIWLRTLIATIAANPGDRAGALRAAVAVAEVDDFFWDSVPMALARGPIVAANVEQMVMATRALHEPEDRLMALWLVAQPLILGLRGEALEVAVREAVLVERSDQSRYVGIELFTAWVQAEADDPSGARALLEAVLPRATTEWVFAALAQTRIGETGAALSTAKRIVDAGDRALVLAWIAASGRSLAWLVVGSR